MRISVRGLVVVLMLAALPALGATPSEFYLAMLQKGVSAYDGGRFDAAANPLRIAAFGFVDSVEHYQIAQVYLTLTYDRVGETEAARRAARSVVSAERIEPRYAVLQLPAAARSGFETVAKRLLTPADYSTFERKPVVQQQQPPPVVQNPAPTPQRTPQTTIVPPPVQQQATTTPAKVDPPKTQTATKPKENGGEPPQSKPPAAQPKPAPAKPAPTTTTTTTTAPAKPAFNAAARFNAAEQALTSARLADARAIYREILEQPSLQRDDILRAAEGFYRSRDFAQALRAFDRLGALRRGEEPYRYYIAVALYETGQYGRAKQELAAVLPFIEVTPDVARYRTKIEDAGN